MLRVAAVVAVKAVAGVAARVAGIRKSTRKRSVATKSSTLSSVPESSDE